MPVRLKLLLPGALILGAAVVIALWPMTDLQWRSAWLLAGAVAVLACQWLLNERWVVRALGAVQAALAGHPGSAPPGSEWREVVDRVACLHAASARDGSTLQQAIAHAREVEAALQGSEQRYLLAVRGAGDGLWEWDLDSGRVKLSPRWKALAGMAEAGDSIALERWRERLHPEDRRETLDALEAHLRGLSDRFEHAHRLRHDDGQYRWVLSRATALRRANGRAHRVVGIDTDVTRLKRVESLIEAIAEGTAGCTGEDFFKALVRNFARALHVDFAFITECTNRPATRTRALAAWRGDGFTEGFEYALSGTPCEHVILEDRVVFHPQGVGSLYPCERDYESYLGVPIRARDGRVLGHLAFLHRAAMPEDMLVDSVFRIFTARAGAEMELTRALQRLGATA